MKGAGKEDVLRRLAKDTTSKYVTSFVRILAQGGRMFQCAHQQALCARVAGSHLQ